MMRAFLRRAADVIFRRNQPLDERAAKGARLDRLEAEAKDVLAHAERVNAERKRLANYGIVRFKR